MAKATSTKKKRATRKKERTTPILSRRPALLTSRYFPPKPLDIEQIRAEPGFQAFYDEFIEAMTELWYAKPLLIQEHVASDVWKVLVAVTFLNVTAGKTSIPVFFDILDRWKTPAELANAPHDVLFKMIKDLGLGKVRTNRLVRISQLFLDDPPRRDCLRPSRGKTRVPVGADWVQAPYPPTPVSHFPGCGPYALDSYRIFCGAPGEWRVVRPRDKELVKYLQWKWAVEEHRQWDAESGPGGPLDLPYVRALTAVLTKTPISH